MRSARRQGLILVLGVATGASVWMLRPGTSRAGLVAAVGGHRALEPRLTGGFAWGPFQPSRGSEDATRTSVRLAALESEEAAAAAPTPANRASLAVAYLLQGDTARAVELLGGAVEEASDDALLLSDLAAARLGRGRASDANAALALTERALRIEADLPEALFNKALALERLGLRAQAAGAWRSYLDRDAGSPWSGEARERLGALERPSDEAWSDALAARLTEDALDPDAIRRFPQESRELLEETLLPAWGRSLLEGKLDEAARRLRRAHAIAAELATFTGDALALRSVEAIERSRHPEAAARGHVDHALGKARHDAYDYDQAEPLLVRARGELGDASSPFVGWTDLLLAIVRYQRSDLEAAGRALEGVLGTARRGSHHALAGRAAWVLSLVAGSRGRFTPALAYLGEARDAFARAHERENGAAVAAIRAEKAWLLGDLEDSWTAEREALAALPGVRRMQRRQAVLFVASGLSLRQGFPESSLHYLDEFIEVGRRNGNGVATAEGYLHRARVQHRLGLVRQALEDVDTAGTLVAAAAQSTPGPFLEAQLALVRSELLADQDPAAAVAAVDRALAFFRQSKRTALLPRTLLARARLLRRAGRDEEALRDLGEGVRHFEDQQRALRGEAFRPWFFDESWDLFEETMDVLGDDRAFAAAEQSRARLLTEAAVPPGSAPATVGDVARLLPADTVMLYYAVTKRGWIGWRIGQGASARVARSTPADVLRSRVRAVHQALDASDTASVDAAMRGLSEEVLWPLLDGVPPDARFVVVPDGPLRSVPLALLLDRDGKRLIERHPVLSAPSAALALLPADAAGGTPSVLAVGAGRPVPALGLPPLPWAEREAQDVAQRYTSSELLVSGDATAEAFAQKWWLHDVVHFAGHGLASPDHPGLSSLVFGDNRVLAERLAEHRPDEPLRTRLVVLAACSTAAGFEFRGEGSLSVARPFVAAGVPSVVASLREVDDRVAHALFLSFHQKFAARPDAAWALQQAQSELARTSPEGVASWGSFVVVGRTGRRRVAE